MSQESGVKRVDFKYKIGKVKQTPPVMKDPKTGLEYIELKKRDGEQVYGVTKFLGNYKEEKKLGQGTFGEVYKGIHLATQRQVAMKKILVKAENDLFPITAQREITILKRLNHKNVLRLIEMVYDHSPFQNGNSYGQDSAQSSGANDSLKSFYMILPYMVADISGILHNPRMTLDMGDIKNMMLQIFEGINYIHCKKFMHRDIKTANILLDHKGILKIADFGLARNYYGAPPNLKYPGGAGTDAKYTSVVVTRWYRAPELVLGDKNYTTAVDIWGIGCVFAEFFEKKPILQGKTDIDQGHVIFKLMGTPSNDDWLLARYLPGAELTKTYYEPTYKERFGKHLSESGLDLLSKLLALDPYKRVTAMSAVKHPFFLEEPLPKQELKLPCEESHETDIARYRKELHQSMTNLPPAAPSGHIAEVGQPQAPPQPARMIPPPSSLPPRPKAIPSGPRFRDSAPQNKVTKPPSRYLGAQHQYNNNNINNNASSNTTANANTSTNNYGNHYNNWAGPAMDRERDHRYYGPYPESYPRKGDRYNRDDPQFNGYGYRPRGYQRTNGWRREVDARYQRPHVSVNGPNYRAARRDTYKALERPPQPYHGSDFKSGNESSITSSSSAKTGASASISTTSPASTSAATVTSSAVSRDVQTSSSGRLREETEANSRAINTQQSRVNALEARIYGRDEKHQTDPSNRQYSRSGSASKNSENGGSNDTNADPSKRNIVDYY
ncbi:cyclin-dependent serine/threonine protein kinase SGV1 Ecym_7206 [Eremothecium cymbalariae DBVPG|uniref:Serine/threonine-protein kinase BUR1 n=1 Tax=Eremothecium cymbalariae (strain CBS 270.75 / DBVPG 7215 / KCTC 17166 / NRRL Y-17582) TaxID=931890 RepID=G8JW39_ERECY|nr:hypothetical protein Ecym_7206 [Eremothecium cymbalariae DBVPG\